MKLLVRDGIFDAFPEVKVGVLVVRGADNHAKAEELAELARERQKAQESAIAELGNGSVTEHPRIACWREAYRAFGAKPKKHPSSIESLVRRGLKGESLPHINKLVDVYNIVSLSYLLPAGGEDLDAIEGDIELTRASGDEPPVRLLGESEERAPRAGEVIYRDERGILCRRWNWKEADRTKLTEETQNAVLVLEALPPVTREILDSALAALASLIREHAGGEISRAISDHSARAVEL